MVLVETMFAAKSRSLGLVVVTAVVLLVALLPVAEDVTSTGEATTSSRCTRGCGCQDRPPRR